MVRWLARRFPQAPIHHVASLIASDQGIRCRRVNGVVEELAWEELQRVLICTTDQGPSREDVFFVLESAHFALWIPQPAYGCDELLQALQQLSEFDNGAVIQAMACTDNAVFQCWPAPEHD